MIVKFGAIRDLVIAEKHCKSCKIDVKVVPTPPELNPECGMSLLIAENDICEFTKLMEQKNILYSCSK